MFTGSYVAIVTPFKDGKLDIDAYKNLIEMHAKAGTDGIVPCGTTGEAPTLSPEEHIQMIELTVKFVNKRMKVLAGTGSNSTAEAIEYTKEAEKAGADGALIVSPYYNKPTQNGLYEHFKAIAEAVNIPLVIYNIQSRCAVNITTPIMAKLAKIKNIVGVKEASGDLSQMSEIIEQCGNDFDVLSGDDALTLPLLSIGGKGVISVVANIIPADVKAMIEAFNKKDRNKARNLHHKMFPLIKALFIETNPIPIKAAMSLMGLIKDEIRLPLTKISDSNLQKLKEEMKKYGIKLED